MRTQLQTMHTARREHDAPMRCIVRIRTVRFAQTGVYLRLKVTDAVSAWSGECAITSQPAPIIAHDDDVSRKLHWRVQPGYRHGKTMCKRRWAGGWFHPLLVTRRHGTIIVNDTNHQCCSTPIEKHTSSNMSVCYSLE